MNYTAVKFFWRYRDFGLRIACWYALHDAAEFVWHWIWFHRLQSVVMRRV